jgi:hypothetical protein
VEQALMLSGVFRGGAVTRCAHVLFFSREMFAYDEGKLLD